MSATRNAVADGRTVKLSGDGNSLPSSCASTRARPLLPKLKYRAGKARPRQSTTNLPTTRTLADRKVVTLARKVVTLAADRSVNHLIFWENLVGDHRLELWTR